MSSREGMGISAQIQDSLRNGFTKEDLGLETNLVVITRICVNFILSFLLLRRLIKQSHSYANLFYKTKPKEMNRM